MQYLPQHLLLLLFCTAALSQQAEQTRPASGLQPGDLSETVDVRLVNVDVVVTDKKGSPVTGLAREDFRLMEDGKEVTISHFAFYGATAPREQAANSTTTGSTSADTDLQASTSPPPAPLTLAVYLDSRNTSPQHRQRVLGDLQHFLDQSLPSTQWILATFNNRLEIHAGPTPNASTLLAALPTEQKRSSKGLSSRAGERAAYSQIGDSYHVCEARAFCLPCISNWEEMLSYARVHAISEQNRAAIAMGGLADLVGALSGVDGRKAILYVGDGFHQRGAIATFGYVADLCDGTRTQAQNEVFRAILEYDSTTRMQQVTAYANSNRVTLHMLDAGGVHSGMSSSVDFASSKFRPSTDNDRLRAENIQNAHFVMADETGGTAILNASRPFEALTNLSKTFNSGAYSLGFQPTHPPSGRSHRLKVELVGKAAKRRRVRYRQRYQDKGLEAKLVDKLISGLFLELSQNPLNVAVSVGTPKKIKKRLFELPVTVTFDHSAFLNLPSAEPNSSALPGLARVWLSAINRHGDRSDIRQQYLDIPAPTAGQETTSAMVVTMSLVPGSYDIAVGVRDEATREVSVIRVQAKVETARE